MGKLTGSSVAPSPRSSMPAIGKASNVNGDREPILRAPRIKSISTRDYGKKPAGAAAPMGAPTPSFGSLGVPES